MSWTSDGAIVLLRFFDTERERLIDRLLASIQQSDSHYAELPVAELRSLARLFLSALREAVTERSPSPLLAIAPPAGEDNARWADRRVLFDLARRMLFDEWPRL